MKNDLFLLIPEKIEILETLLIKYSSKWFGIDVAP